VKKIVSISLLLSVIFLNTSSIAMNQTRAFNSNNISGFNSEEQVQKYKDEKVKAAAEKEKIERKIENRKKFFGKAASLTLATASVCLGLGSVYLTNSAYKKASAIKSTDKRDLCRLGIGICAVCVPVLGMFAIDSAERNLGKYRFDCCSVGYCTTTSLRVVSSIAVFVNCCKALLKTVFPPQN
jgi:hypothetical protein